MSAESRATRISLSVAMFDNVINIDIMTSSSQIVPKCPLVE